MANVPVVNQGKTKFVKDQLVEHGDAKRAAINEAWQAAGHKDEISDSLVYKMRSQHGSTTRQGDAEEAAKPTAEVEKSASDNKVDDGSAEEKPVEETEDQSIDKAPGKSAFVEFQPSLSRWNSRPLRRTEQRSSDLDHHDDQQVEQPERSCGRGGGGHRRPDVQAEGQRRHARGRGGAACGPKAAVSQR